MRHARLATGLAVVVVALLAVTVGGAAAATSSCGGYRFKLAGATIKLATVTASNTTCSTAKRLAKQCVSATGPSSAWTSRISGTTVTLTNGAKKVTFRLVNVRQSCVGSG
jgi:hypothetical protein